MNKRQKPDGSFADTKSEAQSRYGGVAGKIDNGGEFSWADVDAALLRYAVASVSDHGDAISFAVNRNRSAGSITILAGSERFKYYADNVVEAQAILTQLVTGA